MQLWSMRKSARKPKGTRITQDGGGIAAAIAQDLELTAEQIRDAAYNALVAVEKITGLKPSSKRKPVARKAPPKKVARARPHPTTAPVKLAKPRTRKAEAGKKP
jgi:hypothetical protein